ncbi:MAG: PilZ domain-containing protein [Thermoanaerobaculia bacterium]
MPEVIEQRATERYMTKEPIPGSFGAASIVVLNISAKGVMIEHAPALRPASNGRLWFKQADVTVAVKAHVVWSHLSKTPDAKGKYLYQSGLRVDPAGPDLASALRALAERGFLALDMGSLDRKRQRNVDRDRELHAPPRIVTPEPEITPDQAILISHAMDLLRANPEEARRLYVKAKDSAPDDVVKHGRAVIALWAYLQGTIDPSIIARCIPK